jgi:hypothetical protein
VRDDNIIAAANSYIDTAKRFGMEYEVDNDPAVDTMRLLEEIMNRIMKLENKNAE